MAVWNRSRRWWQKTSEEIQLSILYLQSCFCLNSSSFPLYYRQLHKSPLPSTENKIFLLCDDCVEISVNVWWTGLNLRYHEYESANFITFLFSWPSYPWRDHEEGAQVHVDNHYVQLWMSLIAGPYLSVWGFGTLLKGASAVHCVPAPPLLPTHLPSFVCNLYLQGLEGPTLHFSAQHP